MNEIIVPEVVPTIPLNQSISPVLGTSVVKSKEDAVEVKPWYIWKGRNTYYPSKVEMCIVEEFVKSKSYSKCVKAVKERVNKVVSVDMVKRCLERDHVKDFVVQLMEEKGLLEGWTEGRFLKVITDHIEANMAREGLRAELRELEEGKLTEMSREERELYFAEDKRLSGLISSLSGKILASGDLFAVNLIAKYRGWGQGGGTNIINSINFTERS